MVFYMDLQTHRHNIHMTVLRSGREKAGTLYTVSTDCDSTIIKTVRAVFTQDIK